jgi:hypothetical protein
MPASHPKPKRREAATRSLRSGALAAAGWRTHFVWFEVTSDLLKARTNDGPFFVVNCQVACRLPSMTSRQNSGMVW